MAANYRPISLTSVPCKCIERIIRDEMRRFLSEGQHAFVPAKSCITNHLKTFDIITKALTKNH